MATNSAVHALLWTSKIWEDKYHPVFTGYVTSEHSLHVFKWKFHSGNHQRKQGKNGREMRLNICFTAQNRSQSLICGRHL